MYSGLEEGVLVTADVLMEDATAYMRGDADTGRQRARSCELTAEDNPRLDLTTDNAYVYTDCTPVWIGDAPMLETVGGESQLSYNPGTGTLHLNWTLKNVSDSILAIDERSVAAELLLDRDAPSVGDASVRAMTVAATSSWSSDTEVASLFQGQTKDDLSVPGLMFSGTAWWNLDPEDTTAEGAIARGEPFTLTLTIRIPNASPLESHELLLEVRDATIHTINGGA